MKFTRPLRWRQPLLAAESAGVACPLGCFSGFRETHQNVEAPIAFKECLASRPPIAVATDLMSATFKPNPGRLLTVDVDRQHGQSSGLLDL